MPGPFEERFEDRVGIIPGSQAYNEEIVDLSFTEAQEYTYEEEQDVEEDED
jgi:hypothetical protein